MLHFLEKAGKIAAALGDLPPSPRWPPEDVVFASIPPCYYFHSI